MRLPHNSPLPRAALVGFLLFMLFHTPSRASGWNDYTFDIDQKYAVTRTSAEDIRICFKEPGGGMKCITRNDPYRGDKAGCIYGLYDDKRFIFARCYGANPDGEPTHSDPSTTLYFIVEKPSTNVTGPLSEIDFAKSIKALGYEKPIPWQTVRQAYKASIRAGRTDRSDLFNALFGQLFVIAIMSPMVLIFTLFPGLLVAPFVFMYCRKRRKEWGFGKSWLAGWGGLFLGGVFVLALISLADWFDMMFL